MIKDTEELSKAMMKNFGFKLIDILKIVNVTKNIKSKVKLKLGHIIETNPPISLLISAGILKRLLEKEGKNNDTEICEWFSISKKELDKYYKLYVTKYEAKLK